MDRDQIDKVGLIKNLSEFDNLVCRICLERDGEDWKVGQIIADLNTPTQSPSASHIYSHPDVTFIQDIVTTEEFCAWINDLKGTLRSLNFHLPEPHAQIQRERYSTGLANNHFYGLPYPFTLYTLSRARNEGRRRDPFTPLVKSGLPSFPNYETAFYRFMLNLPYGPGKPMPQDFVVIRAAHPEAWIRAVETEADAVTVVLEGDRCEGTQLTLGGSDAVVVNERVKSSGAQRFELKDANFDHFWVVLSRDDFWIDWRDNRGSGPRMTWDVSGVQPANLTANIEQLRLQGENKQLEY